MAYKGEVCVIYMIANKWLNQRGRGVNVVSNMMLVAKEMVNAANDHAHGVEACLFVVRGDSNGVVFLVVPYMFAFRPVSNINKMAAFFPNKLS